MEFGLPNCELIVCSGKVKYGPIGETWNCLFCNYNREKYEWAQVVNHATSKHKGPSNRATHNRKEQGMHIEFKNDLAIQMEIEYGRIEITNKPNIQGFLTR